MTARVFEQPTIVRGANPARSTVNYLMHSELGLADG